MSSSQTKIQRDGLLAFGAFLIALVLWQFSPFSPIVYPLRLFVTFIHELGHGTTAIVTGGDFIQFQVMQSGAGLAYTSGGIRPLVIAAGYVGTAVFGAILLYVANRTRTPQRLSIFLGVAFAFLTIAYTGIAFRNLSLLELLIGLPLLFTTGYFFLRTDTDEKRWRYMLAAFLGSILVLVAFAARSNPLTVLVGVASGLVLVFIGSYLDRDVNLFVLNFIAFIVGLNAITDAWILLQIVSNSQLVPHNDASSMAREVAFSARFWAVVWMGTAITLLGTSVWLTFIRPWRSSSL